MRGRSSPRPSSGPARRASRSWSAASASTPPAPPTRSRGCRRPSRSASRPTATTSSGEAAAAREAGHEILLQSPMEPFTYPADNPGPHTLLTGASDADNLDSLRWQMGRFVGYVGIVNHLGGKFTADARALTAGARRDRRARPVLSRRRLVAAQPRPRGRADARLWPRPPPTRSSTPTPRRRRSTRR